LFLVENKRITPSILSTIVWDSQPEFVNLLRSPGIDSQLGGPVLQPCLTYGLPGYILAELIPWNRLLGSLNVYKFGLQIRVECQLNCGSKIQKISWFLELDVLSRERQGLPSV
jgi:hypothetical protein